MLKGLYDRVMQLAASRHATPWLAFISFLESSFFPVPPDAMLAPMVLARPQKAWFFAGVCTAASVLGGILGYAIGLFFAEWVKGLLATLGWMGKYAEYEALYTQYGHWVILLKGLTPFPYKIVTIASGMLHYSFPMFILLSVVTRGIRFFLVAALLKWFGPRVMGFVEKRLTLVTTVVAVVIVAAIVLWRYMH